MERIADLKPGGLTGKNAKKMRKAMEQLTQEENAPKKVRTLSPAEVAEGIKYGIVRITGL